MAEHCPSCSLAPSSVGDSFWLCALKTAAEAAGVRSGASSPFCLDSSQAQEALCIRAYRCTKGPNGVPALLRRACSPEAAHVRGVARLLRRGPLLAEGRSRLRVLTRSLSRPLPRIPSRPCSRILREPAPRAAGAAEEVRGS